MESKLFKKELIKLKAENMSDTDKNTFNIEQTRYNLVVNARNFHYENFNKWMTYYYVAFCLVWW